VIKLDLEKLLTDFAEMFEVLDKYYSKEIAEVVNKPSEELAELFQMDIDMIKEKYQLNDVELLYVVVLVLVAKIQGVVEEWSKDAQRN